MAKKTLVVDYNRIERAVWELAEPLVEGLNAKLIDVEFVQEAGEWYLRLYIDREPPVDHELCEQVSRLVDPALDKADPIQQSYYLEVSSPGLERPLKRAEDFQRYAGAPVRVGLYAPLDGQKEYEGALLGLEDGLLAIAAPGETRRFPLETVARVRLKADLD